ncbi:MAG: V-type ATPase 116kDa subunit family protein [Pseudomonadota bacterium]
MLRPVPARWFEALVAHDDVAAALEALARTGTVELEVHAPRQALAPLAELKPALDAYGDLASRYRPYWPAASGAAPDGLRSPREILEEGLERLAQWGKAADPVIRRLQALEHEAAELELWRELFERYPGSEIEFDLLRHPDGMLARRLYVFPLDAPLLLPEGVLARRSPLKHQACVLVVGPPEAVADLDRQATALKGRGSGLRIPPWLGERTADNLLRVVRRLEEIQAEGERARAELTELSRRFAIAPCIATIERLRWFVAQVYRLASTDCFAWLTGWTSDLGGKRLEAALERAGVRALLRFPPPPEGARPPLILRNPWWARPFELFARAIGVPSRDEVDPSPLLALVVPLLFGYMFGDVGQGLVILVAGLALRRRLVVARLFITGGIAAMAFGALFGSVFAREDLIPALWLHPLDEPLTVLVVPLAGGALLLALGLVLNGVEAGWRGEARRWLQRDAGMLLFYAGMLGAVLEPALLWAAFGGLVWYAAGHALGEGRWSGLPGGLGGALESAFQLALNTLSFARVGAFALAHAGLGSATMALAEAASGAAPVVLALGNALIILLEGLVVSIQTTRLVLFEFFIRFLRGEGRPFRPLAVPY